MALSLIDLLELPISERTEANIILNIPILKRKCDLFYHLTDKEAFRLLQNCELIKSTTDVAIPEATQNLCILLKGTVSFCHKVYKNSMSPTEEEKDDENDSKDDKPEKEKKDKVKEEEEAKAEKAKEELPVMTTTRRRTLVLEMVDAVLEHRKSMQEEARKSMQEEARRMSVAKKKASQSSNPDESLDSIEEEVDTHNMFISRTALYGKTVVQYSDGSYFGGPCCSHNVEATTKNDTFTYVADTNCTIILIPPSLQTSIVNYHYLNTIRDKENLLLSHHISRRLPKAQQSALLHEMLEEHFVHGNVLTKRGEPADTVYLIKEGFARIYLDVKVPKEVLPEAVQHLPSTQLKQRLTTVKLEVMDVGPGEFVGGFEQLIGHKTYLFNIETTCKAVAYNMRGNQFKEIVLRENSKPLNLFKEDLKMKWRIRREVANFSLCPEIDKILRRMLGEEIAEEESSAIAAHIQEAMMSESLLRRKSSLPYYMHINVSPVEYLATEMQSMRPANRGPFADRVRNRMAELGFKSRRGIN